MITLVYLLGVVFWSIVYTGVAGFSAAQARVLARFSIHVLVFTVALAWIAMAAATFRRTVGTALVTACIACIALAFLTRLPHNLVAPRFVFMRYFVYPLGDLLNPWGGFRSDNPFRQMFAARDFYLVMLITPLLFVIPAVFDFKRRDITE